MSLYSLFYYSNNATPDVWTNTAFVSFKITDSIQSRVSCLEINIPDPRNVNASLFFKYQRVKIVEQQTGSSKILFLGRVDEIVPVYDSDFGQIIKLTCRDYLAEFVERALNYNYTAAARSTHINTITGTGAGGYASTTFTRSITTSGSSSTVARDTRNGQLTPLALIEEFAAEDPWTNSTWNSPSGAVWRWTPSAWTNNTVEADSAAGTPFTMFSSAASYRYFGRNNPFGGLEFDLATNGSYGSITWEYWNSVTSAWTSLNVTLTYAFTADGIVLWDIPAEWGTRTITNGNPHSGAPPDGTSRYWVRAKTISIVTDATINSIAIVQGNGYDYYIDWSTSPQTIYYYRRGSLPTNGPRTNGLTIEYAGTESDTVRAMAANYSFYEIPREIITRVTARGVDSTGTNVSYTETNAALETEIGMVKEHLEYMYGSVTAADCQVRAQAILYNKGRSSIKRGAVSFFRVPYYVITGTTYLLRAGQLVRVKCSPRSLDEDFLCIEAVYAEPECVTSLNLLSNAWGRGCGVTDLVNNLIQLRETGSLSTARIGDLVVGSAKITSCSISVLTVGTLGEMGTIGGGGWQATGTSSAKILFDSTGIKGYDTAGTQRYQILNDGSGWFGASGSFNWTSAGAVHITDAAIDSCSISKLTAGDLTVFGKITTGGWRTANSGTRIEITSSKISGYNGSTEQFYLQASDGKAYCGGGVVILDSNGVIIKGGGSSAGLLVKDSDGTLGGAVYGTDNVGYNLMLVGNQGVQIGSLSGDCRISINLIPNSGYELDLGSSSVSWRNFYVDNIYMDGSPSLEFYENDLVTNGWDGGSGHFHNIRPYYSGLSYGSETIGTSTYPYYQGYFNELYCKSLTNPYDDKSDMELIKNIKIHPKGHLDHNTFPESIKEPDEKLEKYLSMAIDSCEKRKKDTSIPMSKVYEINNLEIQAAQTSLSHPGINLSNWISLIMGATKELDARLEKLEGKTKDF